MSKRRIGVFTGSRAEYGLLVPVLRAIEAAPELELVLIAGGTHVANEADGFTIAAQVPVEREDARAGSTSRAIGTGILAITDALEDLALDIFVVYGDRFEAFAAMIAATQMSIPTAHIEGGDITQGGTLDDVVRHAMTKLAHIHLTTNAEAAMRVRLLGEEPWRIHNVGFPTIDLIRAGDYADAETVTDDLGLDPEQPVIVFTQHPITTSPAAAKDQIAASLSALDQARSKLGAQIVLTYPNGDLGSEEIITALKTWASSRPDVVLRQSLGRRLYHGALNFCGHVTNGICVGNSSSGVKETMAFDCPAVDIGPRQTGRLRGMNVAHVPHEAGAIFAALHDGLTDASYRAKIIAAENPYGKGDTGSIVARLLSELDLIAPGLLAKQTILPPD
ncbi:MAG: UDP-N-acetylglucosamine 2-epimerase (hydrolyzing) [Silicimonas sp.]|nr:UDP-N-acetylglucosamine 2-epimerase (hydrolyzing) [Silicimonas sp.]